MTMTVVALTVTEYAKPLPLTSSTDEKVPDVVVVSRARLRDSFACALRVPPKVALEVLQSHDRPARRISVWPVRVKVVEPEELPGRVDLVEHP